MEMKEQISSQPTGEVSNVNINRNQINTHLDSGDLMNRTSDAIEQRSPQQEPYQRKYLPAIDCSKTRPSFVTLWPPTLSTQLKSTSRKHRKMIDFPRLIKLNPARALTNAKRTEVWIKGSHFAPNVRVMFGEFQATVLEVEKMRNVIILEAPQRADLMQDTTVEVKVFNVGAQHEKPASEHLQFTYCKPILKRSKTL